MKLTKEQIELIENEFLHMDDRYDIFECISEDTVEYLTVYTVNKLVELIPELKKLL